MPGLAAVSVVLDSLTAGADLEAGRSDEPTVSPSLPTILRALGDRDIRATFFASEAVAESEPLALTMVQNAAHEHVLGRYEGAAAVRDADFLAASGDLNALHRALQIAVADALRDRAHAVLVFTPGLLERRDALAVFVETLELIEGLRAAERITIPTLSGGR